MEFADIRHPKKRAFLAAYALTGNVSRAALAAGIDRHTHNNWLKGGNGYAEAFASAEQLACDSLEAEARRRAVDGVNEPVIWQGQLMGHWVDADGLTVGEGTDGARWVPLTVRKVSDTLLIFLLKGAMPEKYRENQRITHAGDPNAPISHIIEVPTRT